MDAWEGLEVKVVIGGVWNSMGGADIAGSSIFDFIVAGVEACTILHH
jgi:hypothetical protein